MPRYSLRTLLIVLAIGPMVLAFSWWKYSDWKAEQERLRAEREAVAAGLLKQRANRRSIAPAYTTDVDLDIPFKQENFGPNIPFQR